MCFVCIRSRYAALVSTDGWDVRACVRACFRARLLCLLACFPFPLFLHSRPEWMDTLPDVVVVKLLCTARMSTDRQPASFSGDRYADEARARAAGCEQAWAAAWTGSLLLQRLMRESPRSRLQSRAGVGYVALETVWTRTTEYDGLVPGDERATLVEPFGWASMSR